MVIYQLLNLNILTFSRILCQQYIKKIYSAYLVYSKTSDVTFDLHNECPCTSNEKCVFWNFPDFKHVFYSQSHANLINMRGINTRKALRNSQQRSE